MIILFKKVVILPIFYCFKLINISFIDGLAMLVDEVFTVKGTYVNVKCYAVI